MSRSLGRERDAGRITLATGATLLGSVVVALLLCEGLARLVEHVGCVPRTGGVNRFDRFYGWGNRPGARLSTRGCVGSTTEYGADVSVNAEGLRGPEVRVARGDAARILVLGDSFTAGMQVDDGDVYTRRLETRLRARGHAVEVLNAGVNAWSTDNELAFWRREGRRYAPDLVLLAFDTTNDVFENQRRLVALYPWWPDKPHATLRAGVLTFEDAPLPPLPATRRLTTDVGSLLAGRSGVFRLLAAQGFLSPRFFFLPSPPVPADAVPSILPEIYRVSYPEVWTEAWRITRGLILRLRRDVERPGRRFAVVVVNPREEVAPVGWTRMLALSPQLAGVPLDRDKPNRLITRFLARKGIPTIELLPAFRARFPDGVPGFFDWNIHWAPSGHALAAEVIADEIERQGLLAR